MFSVMLDMTVLIVVLFVLFLTFFGDLLCKAVLQSLLDQMKWRGYNLWQTYHLSQTRVSCCTDGVDKKEVNSYSYYRTRSNRS